MVVLCCEYVPHIDKLPFSFSNYKKMMEWNHFSKNSLLLNVNMAKIWFNVKFIRHLFLHICSLHNRRFWSKTLGCFEARFDISILLVYHFWIAWKALKEVSKSSQKYILWKIVLLRPQTCQNFSLSFKSHTQLKISSFNLLACILETVIRVVQHMYAIYNIN